MSHNSEWVLVRLSSNFFFFFPSDETSTGLIQIFTRCEKGRDRGTTCAGMAQIAPWDLADGGACLIRLVWPSAGYAGHAGYAWPSAGQVGINVAHARIA